MAMMRGLLVAAEDARFAYPEGTAGITGGMIARLAARIARAHRCRTGHHVGRANRIVSNGSEIDEAVALAGK